ncbi:YezD family protein [Geotalea daltonii]|nr:YezD family protein [Geotalea daltonii]
MTTRSDAEATTGGNMQNNGEGSGRQLWSIELEEKVKDSLASIRFGTLTLIIQDGKVIRMDRNEKIRLTQ